MGITKTDGFNEETTKMSQLLKAIGHPARLSILHYLANSPSCICNDIVEELPLAQPTISRHLSELKNVGLIQGTITGNNICYCINEVTWKELITHLDSINTLLINKNTCC